jgi:glucan biosynthesis protein C
MKQRRYDIDWLRVLATLAIFIFHCARFFDTMDWHLKNPQRSDVATVFVVLLALWEMPLFFLLSGVGSWYALQSRNGGQYLFERVKRLLIPLYTVGAFILLPPQFYIDRVSHGGGVGSIWDVVPPYFGGSSFRFLLDAPYLTNIWPGHLWFLQLLFNVCVLTLPLLLYLRSESGQRLISRLAGWCARRGGIFLFLIPLLLVRFCFRRLFGGGEYPHTWTDVFEYAVFFVIGYLVPADKRFTESVKRHGWVCLALGIAGFAVAIGTYTALGYNPLDGSSFSWTYVLFQVVWSTASWSWIVLVLSLGAKHLNFNNKVLSYANAAVLPFYVLHQTVILLVGRYVIPLRMSILPKYLIISASSFVLILAIYEVLIKRINPMRFLFGMRFKKRSGKQAVVPQEIQSSGQVGQ